MAPKTPKTPSPQATAAAQTSTNINSALANAYLNNVNQYGPDGSKVYNTTGSTYTDPTTGIQIPQFEERTTLSDAQQAIKDQTDAAELGLGKIANQQTDFLQNYLSQPVDLDTPAIERRLMDLNKSRLDPYWAEREQQLDSRLSNQGIKLGSTAYDRAKRDFEYGRNDQLNQLLLNGRQQAVNEILTQRNQPLNEINALLSSSQVSNPQFNPVNMGQIPTVDYAGLVNQDYQNRVNAYNNRQSSLGGLFGTIGSGVGALLSDRRSKKDIKKVGNLKGQKLYEYHYKGEHSQSPKHIGVMAQEVKKKRPDAVVKRPDGYMAVDYGRLFGS